MTDEQIDTVEQDERGAFEAEWKRSGWGDSDTKNQCFHFWQACAASTSANVAQGAEAMQPLTDAILRRMLKDENRGDTVYRCGYNQAIENVRKILAMRSYLAAPPAQTALTGRVLTYRNQPDNVGAWRLGEACRRAAELPAGDYIDRGLGLLKELQAKGYGVIALTAAQSASASEGK